MAHSLDKPAPRATAPADPAGRPAGLEAAAAAVASAGPTADNGHMEPSLLRFSVRHARGQQISLIILTLIAFPFLYLSLELPKMIVNQGISGRAPEGGDLAFPISLMGYSLDQMEYLLTLAGGYLALVLINGAFKFRINTLKGIMAERLLRRLRTQLLDRVLHFPLQRARRFNSGELISMVSAETEPLGGYFGDAVVTPLFQGGTLLTIICFMFAQNWVMGLAALSMVPVQGWLVPKLQRRINRLAVERVRSVRGLSNDINRIALSLDDIHANDQGLWERATLSDRLGQIFHIRYQIYRLKFLMKFLNNFLNQVTPFFFYAIGGVLVLRGELSLGALVAALSAYKDLTAPWKELLNFYQRRADAKLKYETLREAFDGDVRLEIPDNTVLAAARPVPRLTGDIQIQNLSYEDEHGTQFLSSARGTLPGGCRTLITGGSSGTREVFSLILNGVLRPGEGQVRFGGQPLAELSREATGRRIGLVPAGTVRIADTLRDYLLSGLRHEPPREAKLTGRELREAERVAAIALRPVGDWTDYTRAGITRADALRERGLQVLREVGLETDMLLIGMDQVIRPEDDPDLVARLMQARRLLQQQLAERGEADAVRTFDINRFNNYASIGENILFGVPQDPAFEIAVLGNNPRIWQLIEDLGMAEEWRALGLAFARRIVTVLDGLNTDHPLFEQFEFVTDDMLRGLSAVVADSRRAERAAGAAVAATPAELLADQEGEALLRQLPFYLTVQRHRLGLVDDVLRGKILALRRLVQSRLAGSVGSPIEAFDQTIYAERLSVASNVLFGRVAHGRPEAEQVVRQTMREVLEQVDAIQPLIALALKTELGRVASRLSPSQWQRLALARALMKRPDVLILQDGLSQVDPAQRQQVLDVVRHTYPETTVVWLSAQDPMLDGFERRGSFVGGRLTGLGAEEEAPGAAATAAEQARPVSPLDRDVEYLGGLALFQDLDPGELRRLAVGCRRLNLRAGEVLLREGQSGDTAYVVLEGAVAISRQVAPAAGDPAGAVLPDQVLSRLGPGSLIGEIALFARAPRTATVTAVGQTALLELRPEVLEQLIYENPRLGLSILRTVTERLVATHGPAPAMPSPAAPTPATPAPQPMAAA